MSKAGGTLSTQKEYVDQGTRTSAPYIPLPASACSSPVLTSTRHAASPDIRTIVIFVHSNTHTLFLFCILYLYSHYVLLLLSFFFVSQFPIHMGKNPQALARHAFRAAIRMNLAGMNTNDARPPPLVSPTNRTLASQLDGKQSNSPQQAPLPNPSNANPPQTRFSIVLLVVIIHDALVIAKRVTRVTLNTGADTHKAPAILGTRAHHWPGYTKRCREKPPFQPRASFDAHSHGHSRLSLTSTGATLSYARTALRHMRIPLARADQRR
jgi:hypothetical protein